MTTRRTILFVHSGHDWIRGSERVLLDLAAGLSPSRFRPVVWCNAPRLRAACRESGIEIVAEGFPGASERPWWKADAEPVREMERIIRQVEAAVVHVNTLECLPWALHGARAAKIPVVSHLHLPTTTDERIWSGLHQASLVVGVSRSTLAWVGPDGAGAGATRLVYNAVVPERLERGDASQLRRELGISDDSFVVVTVGSLIPRKDVGTVIEAIRLARVTIPRLHFLVVGDGERRAQLERQSADAGLSDSVHFLGERENAGAILRDAANLLVSAAKSETFGLNVVEAGYFGVPSLVTAIPPHREIVEEGRDGLLFEPGDSVQLAEKLTGLASDPVRRRELGLNAKVRVQNNFLAERFLQEFEGIYDGLMSRPMWRNGWVGGLRIPTSYWRLLVSRATGGRFFRPATT